MEENNNVFYTAVKLMCDEVRKKVFRYKFLVLIIYVTLAISYIGYVLVLHENNSIKTDIVLFILVTGVFLTGLIHYNKKIVSLHRILNRTDSYIRGVERVKYRMHENIMTESELIFYKNGLKHELVMVLNELLDKDEVDLLHSIETGELVSSL